jgi:hypothetical protein
MVHKHLVFAASCLYDSPVSKTYDVVVAHPDPPYDATLYDAILGALFVGMAAQPVVRPGGVIILPARMYNAIGENRRAQNFYAVLTNAHSRDVLITNLLQEGCRPGEERALKLARLMEQNEVIVVGSEFPELVEACRIQALPDMAAAVDLTRWLLGDELDVLIVPHALHITPSLPVQEQSYPYNIPLIKTLL